jgi:hypothetical protein
MCLWSIHLLVELCTKVGSYQKNILVERINRVLKSIAKEGRKESKEGIKRKKNRKRTIDFD